MTEREITDAAINGVRIRVGSQEGYLLTLFYKKNKTLCCIIESDEGEVWIEEDIRVVSKV